MIHYAIHARTALIKLLVLLKWKNQADVDQVLPTGEKQGRVSLAPVSLAFVKDTNKRLGKANKGRWNRAWTNGKTGRMPIIGT